jgi:uncharacterized protein (DUF58 family)
MADESGFGKYLNPKDVIPVQRLDLQAKCIVEGFISGRHQSPHHGLSSQFSEHRKYNTGDPIKHVDWNVYAKTERHYIKKYEDETNLECTICIDTSSSMGYKHEDSDIAKLDYAILLAAAISHMLTKQQDSVGLITFDQELCQYIRSRSKLSHLADIINSLANIKADKKTDFKTALPQAIKLLNHRGLIVIFSDFLGETEAAIQALAMMRHRKNNIVVFHIMDQAELDLPFSNVTQFIDSENNELQVKANADDIKKAYKAEIDAFTKHVENECCKIGISYLLLSTSEPFDKALQEFLIKRQKCF